MSPVLQCAALQVYMSLHAAGADEPHDSHLNFRHLGVQLVDAITQAHNACRAGCGIVARQLSLSRRQLVLQCVQRRMQRRLTAACRRHLLGKVIQVLLQGVSYSCVCARVLVSSVGWLQRASDVWTLAHLPCHLAVGILQMPSRRMLAGHGGIKQVEAHSDSTPMYYQIALCIACMLHSSPLFDLIQECLCMRLLLAAHICASSHSAACAITCALPAA